MAFEVIKEFVKKKIKNEPFDAIEWHEFVEGGGTKLSEETIARLDENTIHSI